MDLVQLSVDREQWQINTLATINARLRQPESSIVLTEADQEEHNVLLYGFSQTGKTTLILTLIGIDPAHMQAVSAILRGGQGYGNSATATATMYLRSPTRLYGIAYREDDESLTDIQYYQESDFSEQLRVIRERVESNRQSRKILLVYIPQQYFMNRENRRRINIIDMPGVESRNEKEKKHLEQLMALYFASADCRIIVCPAHNIEVLRNSLPGMDRDDWMYFSSRYLLVTTFTYHQESVRNYFLTDRCKRLEDFENYVQAKVESEVRRVLGNQSTVLVFPLDLGASYNRLLEAIKDPQDRSELQQTRNSKLEALYQAIEDRSRRSLQNTIKMIRENAQSSLEQELREIRQTLKDISDHIEELGRDIASKKELLSEANKKMEANKKTVSQINNAIRDIPTWNADENTLSQIQSQYIKNGRYSGFLQSGNLTTELENFLTDSFKNYIECVKKAAGVCWSEKWTDDFPDLSLIRGCLGELDDILLRRTIFDELLRKISKQTLDEMVDNAVRQVKKRIGDAIKGKVDSSLKELLAKAEDTIRQCEQVAKNAEGSIESLKNDLEEQKKARSQCEIDVKEVEKTLAFCQNILTEYRRIAQREYEKQITLYKKRLYSSDTNAEEKARLVILMGLMERDRAVILKEG